MVDGISLVHSYMLARYVFAAMLLLASTLVPAKDFRVCLASLPTLAEQERDGESGILVDLIKAMAPYYHREGRIRIVITPFARSFHTLQKGGCDIHLPMLENPDVPFKEEGLRLANDVIFKVPFVIYSRADRPPLAVGKDTGLHLETDLAHIHYFPFPIAGSSCLACSLKKVLLGRIDGVIFAAKEMNTLIRRERLTGLRAMLYRQFDVHPVVRSDSSGDEAEQIFHRLFEELKRSGESAHIMKPLLIYDWKSY